MGAGGSGVYVVSWSETEIDGLKGGPVAGLEQGVTWQWSGRAVRVDGPVDSLAACDIADQRAFRNRAATAVRRLLGPAIGAGRRDLGAGLDLPLGRNGFRVTDGRRSWEATLVDLPEAARPLVVFLGGLPPAGVALLVAEVAEDGRLTRRADSPTGVICFTRGTRLRTPMGERAVEDLVEGDRLSTRDDGAQEIVWIGRRRMTGARLYAMPELRPIRFREGALGDGEPTGDLVVSPRHRMLVRGAVARALFGADEVLVAAEDLLNDHSIRRDHALREVEYVHLLLPRHQIVWANGVETESFHPGSTDLATIDPDERLRLAALLPEVEADPRSYGAPARRELTRAQAAILAHAGQRRV